MVVLHYTAMESAEAALARLCDPTPPEGLSPVSCHYLISELGEIWQMVDEQDRAWHAGVGAWGPVRDVNSHSVGIELANRGDHPFSEPQMDALERVLDGIMGRWSIPPARVIGHSDMAPGRKADPGVRFDWQRLARRRLAIWPDGGAEAPLDVARFLTDLQGVGYPVASDGTDAVDPDLLWSFRARFRPWAADASSALDPVDCALAAELAARWPCDGRGEG